jgi:lipopolysaccharide transport system permease protein
VILPFAAILSNLVDLAIAFIILLGMMAYYRVVPGTALLALPLFLLLAMISALAVGLWLSALNAKYRDIGYIIPFLLQFWLFLTPVAYSSSLIPLQWRMIYSLNPMTVVVEGFRWALLGQQNLSWNLMLLSISFILVIFIGGLIFFRRTEFEFADVL